MLSLSKLVCNGENLERLIGGFYYQLVSFNFLVDNAPLIRKMYIISSFSLTACRCLSHQSDKSRVVFSSRFKKSRTFIVLPKPKKKILTIPCPFTSGILSRKAFQMIEIPFVFSIQNLCWNIFIFYAHA